MAELGFMTRLRIPYAEAVEKVTAALKVEGFGILTSIDVRETMKKKLDVNFRPYTILGACNPPLAHRALTTRPEVGLLLPCNVIVYDDGEESVINIIDPSSMVDFLSDPSLEPVAEEARKRLLRVTESLKN